MFLSVFKVLSKINILVEYDYKKIIVQFNSIHFQRFPFIIHIAKLRPENELIRAVKFSSMIANAVSHACAA